MSERLSMVYDAVSQHGKTCGAIWLAGPAMGYQRARHQGRRHWHTPEHMAYEARVVEQARTFVRFFGQRESVRLTITVWHGVKDKRRWGKPTHGKPDLDNVAKLLLDGLKKGGMYLDDTRVVKLAVARVGCEPDKAAVEVMVGWDDDL